MSVLTLSAVAGGILVVFTFLGVTWKLLRFIFKVDRALPTLLNIAYQFENNGGSTLKDKIDDIAERAEEIAIENRLAVKIAEDSRLVANTNAAIVNELTRVQNDEITEVKEYLHEKLSEVSDKMSVTAARAELTEQRSQRIEQRLDKLLPLVVRNRATDRPDNEGESAT